MATSFLAKNKAQKNANRTMYSGMRDKRILIYGDNSQGKTKQTTRSAIPTRESTAASRARASFSPRTGQSLARRAPIFHPRQRSDAFCFA